MTNRNGADALLTTLADCGISVCFANPGTSEMHLVAALDREPRIRPVLCLFEGVATGAADGFARIAGVPAMTLLHLGPGYANGAANLHNARRAFSSVVNVVGDHATTHASCDAPLASDIEGAARPTSVWVQSIERADEIADGALAAFTSAMSAPGGPATLIVPADCAWSACAAIASPHSKASLAAIVESRVAAAAAALKAAKAPAVLLGGSAMTSGAGLAAAARLAHVDVTVFADTFVARQLRGGDRFEPQRLPYFVEDARDALGHHDLLMLAGTQAPVSFFAYPDRPSTPIPPNLTVQTLCEREEDVVAWLSAVADVLGATAAPSRTTLRRPESPAGRLTPETIGLSLARHMAADTIVSDDGVTSGGAAFGATARGVAHDWLSLTGGAIGQGMPLAIGAAIARPGARVVALTGDGAAMYTPQALWTMAREHLDVTVVVYANRAYRILDIEYARTRSGARGSAAHQLLGIGDPTIDWCAMASAMGVPAVACDSAEGFDEALATALRTPGPRLIEARIA